MGEFCYVHPLSRFLCLYCLLPLLVPEGRKSYETPGLVHLRAFSYMAQTKVILIREQNDYLIL